MKNLALSFIVCIIGIVAIAFLATRPPLHIKGVSAQSPSDLSIFHDQLNADFSNWSWGSTISFAETGTVNQGSDAIGFQPSAWGGLYLHTDKAIDASLYDSLSFALYATQPGQKFIVMAYDSNNNPIGSPTPLSSYGGELQQNTWTQFTIPLSDLHAQSSQIKGFVIQETTGQNQPKLYIDEIVLKAKAQPQTSQSGSGSASVYDDSLQSGWENWSWDSSVTFDHTNPVYAGSHAIAFTANNAWAGLYLHSDTPVDTTGYSYLQFAFYATQANQKYSVVLHDANYNILGNPVSLDAYGAPTANSWKVYSIPLSDLHAANQHISGIVLQEAKGQAQPVVYIDAVALTSSQTPITQATTTTQVQPSLTPPPTTPDPTVTATPTPAPVKKFTTLPPGAALPSSQECAQQVRRSSFEPRPENYTANHTTGVPVNFPGIDGATPEGNNLLKGRIDGSFTGTTDEIIQWGACKWGFDEDIVRAVAAQESWWRQSTKGDFNGSDYESYGLLQVRRTSHVGTYPMSEQSTPFNVDFALAWRRACYEGYFTWIPASAKGDEWGCIGLWYSGKWYDGDVNTAYSGANWYIGKVKQYLAEKPWLKSDF
jgi:hypothetical protein